MSTRGPRGSVATVVREGSPRGSEILSAHLPVVPRACKGLAAIAPTNTRQASVGPAGGTRVNAVNSIKSGYFVATIAMHGIVHIVL